MGSPNVLLVVLDATRKDHLSCYGYDRPTTPELDALAQAGTRYEQAIAPAPWTPPSHASMFTGRYPSGHGSFGTQPLGEYDGATVAELLSAAGYATFGFSNSHHTSIEQEFDRGFDYYHDILALPRFMDTMYEPSLDFLRFLPRYFRDGYDISDFQRRKLETQVRRADDPFFGFINFNAAHAPYRPPEEFRAPFEERFDDWDVVDETAARKVGDDEGYEYILGDVTMSATEWELVECWYDAEIRYVDALLGELFDCLRRQGVYDDTLVVEPSSGNTGTALARLGVARGYDVEIVMPEEAPVEKAEAIRTAGGTVTLAPDYETMLDIADRRVAEADAYMPDQYANPANSTST